MALIDKLFSFKGNRQFSEAEDKLIDALNNMDDFVADEAYINYTHTALFAIDKELRKFLLINNSKEELITDILPFDAVSSFTTSIKDRADEEWMQDFSKWKKQKKYIKSISILIQSDSQEMFLEFFRSENKEGDRVSNIPVKRALFSLEKWDEVLYKILDNDSTTEQISEENPSE